MDTSALHKLGYGLYVLTAKTDKDNGCIVNTVMQITSQAPTLGVVAVNKGNYTHDMLVASKQFNVSCLTTQTPFSVFERFGFHSGEIVNKFADGETVVRSQSGLIYLNDCTNAYLSFAIKEVLDFGTHTLFKSEMTDAAILSDAESLTYAHYHKYIKPNAAAQSGWRCKICSYVYEGANLPSAFICPICKHGASDFEPIN
ncbi:MAG: flavin reductase [Oscillospiraceae bacterium]|nr:flavin reductase [Oscillospiraceae bacterium]